MNTRTATKEDFKAGAVIFDPEGNRFCIKEKYDEGIWETRQGNVVFEGEAACYTVEA